MTTEQRQVLRAHLLLAEEHLRKGLLYVDSIHLPEVGEPIDREARIKFTLIHSALQILEAVTECEE